MTQADLARRYGYFLDFIDRSGHFDRAAEAGAQVTPEAVANFIAELQARVGSVTVSRTISRCAEPPNVSRPTATLPGSLNLRRI